MSRPRTPAAVAKVTGADVLHKTRHASRAKPKVRGLGQPYAWMTEAEAEAWREMREEMPWLASSDRKLVALACRLHARFVFDPEMGVNALAQYRMCLQAMGGTPSDRTKVAATDDDEPEDPVAGYFS